MLKLNIYKSPRRENAKCYPVIEPQKTVSLTAKSVLINRKERKDAKDELGGLGVLSGSIKQPGGFINRRERKGRKG